MKIPLIATFVFIIVLFSSGFRPGETVNTTNSVRFVTSFTTGDGLKASVYEYVDSDGNLHVITTLKENISISK